MIFLAYFLIYFILKEQKKMFCFLNKVHLLPLFNLWFVSNSRCRAGWGRGQAEHSPALSSLRYRWSEGEPGPNQALSKPALAPHTQVEIFSHWLDLTRDGRVSPELHDTGNVNNCSIINTHITCKSCDMDAWHDSRDLHTIKMTKLISGIPPLGKPVLYTIGLCFVSLFLIYSMDVSNRSWLSRDIIDQVKYKEVKWTEPSFRSVYQQCLGRLQVKIQLMIVTTWPHTAATGSKQWLTVASGSHISSLCLFSYFPNNITPVWPPPSPTPGTLTLVTHHPGQLPTLFPHNFLPGALSTVYLFLRSDFLTTPLTSLFGYKMFYFTPA